MASNAPNTEENVLSGKTTNCPSKMEFAVDYLFMNLCLQIRMARASEAIMDMNSTMPSAGKYPAVKTSSDPRASCTIYTAGSGRKVTFCVIIRHRKLPYFNQMTHAVGLPVCSASVQVSNFSVHLRAVVTQRVTHGR